MLFTLLSAVMYVLPFFYPQLSFALFFFLVPIMYQSYFQRMTAFHGLVWGFVVFTSHTSWFSGLLFFTSTHPLRITVILLTISWFLLSSMIWFFSTEKLRQLFSNKVIGLIVSWFITTTLYFLYIIKGSLFVCGQVEGYTFFNPFIPLAYYPYLLWPLNCFGFLMCLIVLIAIQLFLALGLVSKKVYLLVPAFAFAALIIGSVRYEPKQALMKQALMKDACFVQPWWHKSKDPIFAGYRMIHDVSKALHENNDIKTVILPESSFPWDITNYSYLLEALCDNPELLVIFGGQRKVNNTYTNSCIVVSDSNIVFAYDKMHLMPLVEREDFLCKRLWIKNLFSDEYFSYPVQQQNDLIGINGQQYQIFLCSELYFEAKPVKGVPILFLGNDDWFYCDYAKKLSELFIAYFEICYGVPVLYCTTGGYSNITKVTL